MSCSEHFSRRLIVGLGLRDGEDGEAEKGSEVREGEPDGVVGGVESRRESLDGSPESAIRRRESIHVGGLCSSSASVTHQVPGRNDRVWYFSAGSWLGITLKASRHMRAAIVSRRIGVQVETAHISR